MPLIDVNEVLTDPLIAGERFEVIRRLETVNTFGERSSSTQRLQAYGSITPTGENSMVREEGYQSGAKTIHVVTPFMLRGPSTNQLDQVYDPDQVIWRGDTYVVKTVNDYSQYGAGMIEADCISTDFNNQAPHNP